MLISQPVGNCNARVWGHPQSPCRKRPPSLPAARSGLHRRLAGVGIETHGAAGSAAAGIAINGRLATHTLYIGWDAIAAAASRARVRSMRKVVCRFHGAMGVHPLGLGLQTRTKGDVRCKHPT